MSRYEICFWTTVCLLWIFVIPQALLALGNPIMGSAAAVFFGLTGGAFWVAKVLLR